MMEQNIEAKRTFSRLYCITCLKDMDEDNKGNFDCPNCLIKIGVLN